MIDFLESETVVVTNNDHAAGNNGIAILPSYHTSVEVWQKLVAHLEEEIAVLRKDKEQMMRMLDKLTA